MGFAYAIKLTWGAETAPATTIRTAASVLSALCADASGGNSTCHRLCVLRAGSLMSAGHDLHVYEPESCCIRYPSDTIAYVA